MTREQIVAAMRALGHLGTVASGYESGHLDEEYVVFHIEVDSWRFRSEKWREGVRPILRALHDLAPSVRLLHELAP